MSAIDDIAAERERQIEAEGWSPEHDDEHENGELAQAASTYAFYASNTRLHNSAKDVHRCPQSWPWGAEFWKPKDKRRDLVRAGALIVAEIERLDRLSIAAPENNDG